METLIIIGLVVLLIAQARKNSKSKNPFMVFHLFVKGIAKSIAFLWNIWCYYFLGIARMVMETTVAINPAEEKNIRLAWEVFILKREGKKIPNSAKFKKSAYAYNKHAKNWCFVYDNSMGGWAAGIGMTILIFAFVALMVVGIRSAHGVR